MESKHHDYRVNVEESVTGHHQFQYAHQRRQAGERVIIQANKGVSLSIVGSTNPYILLLLPQ